MRRALKLPREHADKIASMLNFEKLGGLVPAIAQDYVTGRVLMLGFMNKDALINTLVTGAMHYWSRDKGRIWMKGEESGHRQQVREVYVDCDDDALLFKVEQLGVACHTGEESCFYRKLEHGEGQRVGHPASSILDEVYEVVLDRLRNPKPGSYVASVAQEGIDQALQKLGEEALELILALKGGGREAGVREAADLVFHLILALALEGVSLKEVFEELARRRK